MVLPGRRREMPMPEPARPRGAALLAMVLAYLAVAGAIGAVVIPYGMGPSAASIAYAGSAAVAAIGIWRSRRWASTAFAVWACIALLNGLVIGVLLDSGPVRQAIFFVAMTGVLWLLYRYVRRLPAAGGKE